MNGWVLVLLGLALVPINSLAGGLDTCADADNNPLWILATEHNSVATKSTTDNLSFPGSALVRSVAFGTDRQTVELLQTFGRFDRTERAKALYTAASMGRLTTVALLIGAGVSPNSKIASHNGITPLFGAVAYGCNETLTYLVKMGADVNVPTMAKYTLLELAIAEGHYDTAKRLMQLGYTPSEHEKERVARILDRAHQRIQFDQIFLKQ